jgi:hypothetical protein
MAGRAEHIQRDGEGARFRLTGLVLVRRVAKSCPRALERLASMLPSMGRTVGTVAVAQKSSVGFQALWVALGTVVVVHFCVLGKTPGEP